MGALETKYKLDLGSLTAYGWAAHVARDLSDEVLLEICDKLPRSPLHRDYRVPTKPEEMLDLASIVFRDIGSDLELPTYRGHAFPAHAPAEIVRGFLSERIARTIVLHVEAAPTPVSEMVEALPSQLNAPQEEVKAVIVQLLNRGDLVMKFDGLLRIPS